MNLYIGIDPGIDTGGISFLDDDMILRSFATPTTPGDKSKNRIDLRAICEMIVDYIDNMILDRKDFEDLYIYINVEDVHSTFTASKGSSFTFGGRYREPFAMAAMLDVLCSRIWTDVHIEMMEMQPKTWQSLVVAYTDKVWTADKVDTKATSIKCATRLFPETNFFKSERSKIPHDGMTDSALIAYAAKLSINKH